MLTQEGETRNVVSSRQDGELGIEGNSKPLERRSDRRQGSVVGPIKPIKQFGRGVRRYSNGVTLSQFPKLLYVDAIAIRFDDPTHHARIKDDPFRLSDGKRHSSEVSVSRVPFGATWSSLKRV